MNLSYKAVVQYVKNLFPGTAPVAVSDNPQLDAQVLAYLSSDKFYMVASNGHRYWYCFVENDNIPVAQYVLHSNGVRAKSHITRYYSEREPVVRVRVAHLRRNLAASNFINAVMLVQESKINEAVVRSRIEQIKQRVK